MDIPGQIARMREIDRLMDEKWPDRNSEEAMADAQRRMVGLFRREEESPYVTTGRVTVYAHAVELVELAEAAGTALDFTTGTLLHLPAALGMAVYSQWVVQGRGEAEGRAQVARDLGAYLALLLCHQFHGQLSIRVNPMYPQDNYTPGEGVVVMVDLPDGRYLQPFDLATRVLATATLDRKTLDFQVDETILDAFFRDDFAKG